MQNDKKVCHSGWSVSEMPESLMMMRFLPAQVEDDFYCCLGLILC